ncbi:MAG: hypothetical protein LBR73_03015 [Oscillospiraceae bacterium]|nr:hypothetical protein [Oscillospiraceae bacterium]
MAEYFPGIPAAVYEGAWSTNPFAFKVYNPDRIIGGKPMREALPFCFSAAVPHELLPLQSDIGQEPGPWRAANPLQQAKDSLCASFELMDKLGLRSYCIRDTQLRPLAESLRETYVRTDEMTEGLLYLQKAYGAEPAALICDLRSDPRFALGSFSSPEVDIVSLAAALAKNAVDTAVKLEAKSFVLSVGSVPEADWAQAYAGNLAYMLVLTAEYAQRARYEGRLLLDLPERTELFLYRRELHRLWEPWELRKPGVLLEAVYDTTAPSQADAVLRIIAEMDSRAGSALLQERERVDGRIADFRRNRLATFDAGVGSAILAREVSLDILAAYAESVRSWSLPTDSAAYINGIREGLRWR